MVHCVYACVNVYTYVLYAALFDLIKDNDGLITPIWCVTI